MAGTATQTETAWNGDQLASLEIAWISEDGGANAGKVDATISKVHGTLEGVAFNPSATAAPTADYDVVINDVDGVDVLGGKGADLSDSTATYHGEATTSPVFPRATTGLLTLAITNAGNAKEGTIRLFYRR